MKAFLVAMMLALTTPVYAEGFFTDNPDQHAEFVVWDGKGTFCGICHDELTSQKLAVAQGHLAMSVFADTPITHVFLGYDVHPPMPAPATPLPGALVSFASALAVGAWWMRSRRQS